MGQVAGRRLRSRLLVGAAALAIAAPASQRAVAQEAKWQPWLGAGGAIGSENSFGQVDIFLPVWQDQTSLLFGDLRGTFTSSPTQEGNFGIGYRTQVDSDWILGGYGFIDIQNSKNDNLFYQGSIGAEAMSIDWDFRINGYFPFNSGGQNTNDSTGNIQISGNDIGITHREEKPLFGFDGEVGWRLPIFPADGDMDVRAFIGGYYFANSDVDTVAGPRGRLEVRLYDLDILGTQSRLTFDGEVQWDSPRGTQGFGGLELRIPLGAITGTPGPKLSPLDRRMVDRVQRDVNIVTQKFNSDPSDVVVDGLTVKTHTIVFAREGGTGNGTKDNPTSLENAPALAAAKGQNAIIVVEGNNGDFVAGTDFTQGVQLLPGQVLVGGHANVLLHDAHGDVQAGFKAPGSRPTLVGTTSTANLINLYEGAQNGVIGLNLTGAFKNGIFGLNGERDVIVGNSIGGAANDGIYLFHNGASPITSSFVRIWSNTVTGNGGDGIDVTNVVTEGTAITQAVQIQGNTADGNFFDGIVVYNRAVSAGSVISQSVQIDNNDARFNGYAGIAPVNAASSGGIVSQALVVDPNTVAYNGTVGTFAAGIFAFNFAESGGSVVQNATISDNVAFGNTGAGIIVGNAGDLGGSVTQTVAIDRNDASHNLYPGIALLNRASGGGSVSQVASLTDNTVTGNGLLPPAIGGAGLFIGNYVLTGGVVNQTVSVDGITADGNVGDGIVVDNRGFGSSAEINQSVFISGAVARYNSNGILVRNRFDDDSSGAGAGLSQLVMVTASQITGNHYAGIAVDGRFYNGTNFTQSLVITDNLIASNGFGGVMISNEVVNSVSGGTAQLSQAINIDGNTIVYNSGRFNATSGSAGITGYISGGGIQIVLDAENIASSGIVNLDSSIGITNNLIRNNFVVGEYTGSSSSATFTLGTNLLIERTGFNNANDGTVNITGNALTIANNTIANHLYGSSVSTQLFDVILVDGAVNGTSSNPITGGTVNLVNNVTQIQGNVLENSVVSVGQTGVNLASSGGAVNMTGNALTVQGNTFNDGGLVVSTTAVNYASTGGIVTLQNNSTTIQDNVLSGAPVIVESSVGNFASSGGVAQALGNSLVIQDNTLSDAPILVLDFTVNGSDGNTTGGVASASGNNTQIVGNSGYGGVVVLSTGSNGAASGGAVAVVNNNFTIDSNYLTGSSIGILVFDGISQESGTGGTITLDNNFQITNNRVTGGFYSSGGLSANGAIVFSSILENDNTSGVGVASDSASIAGNSANTIFAIAGAVNGTSGSGTGSGGAVSMANSLTIDGNSLSDGGIFAATFVGNSGPNGTARATNITTIDDNTVSSGGVIVLNTASNDATGGVVSMGNTLNIDRNLITDDTFGLLVFEGAENDNGSASLSSTLNIIGNTITRESFGVLVSLDADSATVSQNGAMTGNTVTYNSATPFFSSGGTLGAVTFLVTASNAGIASQGFALTNNLISENSANGIFTLANGTGATQSISLAGGNVVTNNDGFGLYLVNAGLATVTFRTDATNLTGNANGPLQTSGTVNVVP
jgi:hypothetical protein